MSDEYNILNLEELVARSEYIFLVHNSELPRTVHIMRDSDDEYSFPIILDEPVANLMVDSDEFMTPRNRFVVDEVLYPARNTLALSLMNKVINVYRADVDFHFQLHKESLRGINEMGIYDTYIPQFDIDRNSGFIIFVREYKSGEFEFTIDNAVESIGIRSKIIDILSNPPPVPEEPSTVLDEPPF